MSAIDDILVIDNYDSFTYNLVQYVGEVGPEPRVLRNDVWPVEQITASEPEAIIVSPGPGRPPDAGVSVDIIKKLGETVPLLGVCLGQQCIAAAYGGKIVRADQLLHGKTSEIYHGETPLYADIGNPFTATRYHSLQVDEQSLPAELQVDAVSESGEIMGLHHLRYPIFGVQFHPESILTDAGKKIIENFLDFAASPVPIGEIDFTLSDYK